MRTRWTFDGQGIAVTGGALALAVAVVLGGDLTGTVPRHDAFSFAAAWAGNDGGHETADRAVALERQRAGVARFSGIERAAVRSGDAAGREAGDRERAVAAQAAALARASRETVSTFDGNAAGREVAERRAAESRQASAVARYVVSVGLRRQ